MAQLQDDQAVTAAAARAHAGVGQPRVIELKLRDIDQLFNPMDPSPLIEKDLDDKAEEFIVGWAQEFPRETSLMLRIQLGQKFGERDDPSVIQQAVHNYFAHRTELAELEFRNLMRQGRTSLVIGLSCLAICLVFSQMLPAHAGTWASVLRESLTIAGWVAMWHPMQIYLYDWWPLRRRVRTFAKLSAIPVEAVFKSAN
jgi:hypothetical protein